MQKVSGIVLQGNSRGLLSPLLLFFVFHTTISGSPAQAADAIAACQRPFARVVSIQGSVEVQRVGQGWSAITRLETPLCEGDRLRTGTLSRAALFIQPETLVRVDQNTSISVSQTADETLVEFTQEGIVPASATPHACGAGYFITRFPRKFKVKTPHLNAAVEGTEFLVAMRCESTELSVFEGKVLAAGAGADIFPAQSISSGQVLTIGGSEPPVVKLLVKPTDAVQWVVYYPPLSDATAEADLPATMHCRSLPRPLDQTCLTHRAEALLRLGRVDEAQREVDEAVALDPGQGDANALRAIISIARNDKAGATEAATAATTASPNSAHAWLALSYAQQASFKLEDSLSSARKAQALEPNRSVTNARVAELLMSLGRIKEAEKAARAAVDANPSESRAHTVLGFVHLAQIKTKDARTDFLNAIERDSSDPLPRLGLGLAIIRTGKLAEGREQLEIAVALDPTNSLLRSYIGKAYYEENTKERDALAAIQFGMAKKLDPKDPTPWFYDAILLDSQSRPVEALRDSSTSAQLNRDRAVYRSSLLLDEDLAARAISQGRIYNELGVGQLGLVIASESLAIDPGNPGAHRFLADAYSALPRHEIARASELLQAQLREPVGARPLQAQLANDVLFKNTLLGPNSVGYNEFNPLFLKDRAGIQLYGFYGDPRTYGEQILVSGVHGPTSISLSQLHTYDSGVRINNDDTVDQYDALMHLRVTSETTVQFEVTSSKRETGDLQSYFDSSASLQQFRADEELSTSRVGVRQIIDPTSDLLFSFIYQDRRNTAATADPFAPFTVELEQISRKPELQYLKKFGTKSVVLGTSYFDSNGTLLTDFPTFSFSDLASLSTYHTNAYGYLYLNAPPQFPQIQIGYSYDKLNSSEVGNHEESNPKIGVQWKVADSATLRAAYFKHLKRKLSSDQGLEPTQVVGFNQLFDDPNGTTSETTGVGVDFRISPSFGMGIEGTHRNLEAPFLNLGEILFRSRTENSVASYGYWMPTSRLAVSVQPRVRKIIGGDTFDEMDLREIPLALRLAFPSGLWFATSLTSVWQKGIFDGPGGIPTQGRDHFDLVDTLVAYRMPRRIGTVSLEVNNLFNETFQFQETDISTLPRYLPERRVFARFSLDL